MDMEKTTFSPRPIHHQLDILPQIIAAVLGGLIIFSVLLIGLVIGFNFKYSGHIFPGVMVAGVDLSGLTPDQAAAQIRNNLDYPTEGRITFRDGDKTWTASPGELGLYLDPQATALVALRYGREGDPIRRLAAQFKGWYLGTSLSPRYVLDERATQSYLAALAAQNDRPKVEATLSIEGTNVVTQHGQVGRQMDINATMDSLRSQVQTLQDGEVGLVITEDAPGVLDTEPQAQVARQIISQPLVLSMADAKKNDPGPWTIDPNLLSQLLTIQRVTTSQGDQYQVGLQTDTLRVYLENLAPQISRNRQNARFIFNDDTRKLDLIQTAMVGRSLNVAATIEAINQKLIAGEHKVDLVVDTIQPDVGDDAKAKQLGITELVSSYTSYFYGSSAERIQNISTAASRFHGLLVAPGATFSMGDALGDVSLDNGYAEALIIYGNRTIEGVGGGVCQVSTTLFRTAFFGGYPIVERYPHAYRVGYYEQRADGGNNADLAGLDATVFMPLVDFKFVNDTPSWLLMETYVNEAARTITWKFYSTSDGRKVEWSTSGLENVVPAPDPLYEENPDLAKGEVKQVDWAVDGADVTVIRTVIRDGKVISSDKFITHYIPWQAIYQYGPGTEGMPPDEKPKKKKNQ
jgi:vancomycin resistance protein YoaR